MAGKKKQEEVKQQETPQKTVSEKKTATRKKAGTMAKNGKESQQQKTPSLVEQYKSQKEKKAYSSFCRMILSSWYSIAQIAG